jgi:hypothetical protein
MLGSSRPRDYGNTLSATRGSPQRDGLRPDEGLSCDIRQIDRESSRSGLAVALSRWPSPQRAAGQRHGSRRLEGRPTAAPLQSSLAHAPLAASHDRRLAALSLTPAARTGRRYRPSLPSGAMDQLRGSPYTRDPSIKARDRDQAWMPGRPDPGVGDISARRGPYKAYWQWVRTLAAQNFPGSLASDTSAAARPSIWQRCCFSWRAASRGTEPRASGNSLHQGPRMSRPCPQAGLAGVVIHERRRASSVRAQTPSCSTHA